MSETTVIMRAARCGHHFDEDCTSCRSALECSDHELDSLRAEIERMRSLCEETAGLLTEWKGDRVAEKFPKSLVARTHATLQSYNTYKGGDDV